MIFLSAILIGILVGLLLKGRFTNLWNLSLRHAWLLIPWFLIDTFFNSRFSTVLSPQSLRPIVISLLVLQYGLLILVALINWNRWPLLVVGLGEAANFLVILANGGRMPVDTAQVPPSPRLDALLGDLIPHYGNMTDGTRLAFLCDRIPVRFFTSAMLSVGDIILWFGLLLFMVHAMRTAHTVLPQSKTASAEDASES